jgi:hypothetical protein
MVSISSMEKFFWPRRKRLKIVVRIVQKPAIIGLILLNSLGTWIL